MTNGLCYSLPSLQDPTLAPSLLTEATVRAAYSGPLGNPLIPDASSLAKLTPEALQAFVTGARLSTLFFAPFIG